MKVTVIISNYLDTIDVYVDGKKVKRGGIVHNKTAVYEYLADCGEHTLLVEKKSNLRALGWKKHAVSYFLNYYWENADWSSSELAQDAYTGSLSAIIEVYQDQEVHIALSKEGFSVVDKPSVVRVTRSEYSEDAIAKRRVRCIQYVRSGAVTALEYLIGAFLLICSILAAVNQNYGSAFVPLCVFIFWTWLMKHLDSL